jgi:hypothetical protein
LAELHRIRGKILLKRDAANPAPAEEAFLTAIAVAQQQKARSFELRGRANVRTLGGARASEALSAHEPSRRSPCGSRPCSRRLFDDIGIPGD